MYKRNVKKFGSFVTVLIFAFLQNLYFKDSSKFEDSTTIKPDNANSIQL